MRMLPKRHICFWQTSPLGLVSRIEGTSYLSRKRELLVRERELLAAERRQFFLDRTAHAERSFAQTGDTSDTLAAVNRQFGIPGPESHPEIAKATASTLAASWKDTPSVTAPDHASVREIDREPRHVDPTSEDPEIAPGESDQRDSLDFEKPIDDLRSQLAKLFEMPSAERPAATESIATLDQIRLEIKSVEEIQSDAEKAVKTCRCFARSPMHQPDPLWRSIPDGDGARRQ